ncbi:MAG: hypothetical protein QOJ70_2745 [Acidobacteriota bacterium]|nr:hypothetical protein [Acidobacteriota bacterium]
MRSRDCFAVRKAARRITRPNRMAARLCLAALFLALATPCLLVGLRPAGAQVRTALAQKTVKPATTQPTQVTPLTATSITPVSITTVNFNQLAAKQASSLRAGVRKVPTTLRAIHPPLTVAEGTTTVGDSSSSTSFQIARTFGPAIASPAPSTTYLGQEDGPKIGSSEFDLPPDTQGAVGLDKVFVNTNSNYRIQNKTTGAALSTVSSDTFWAGSGGTGFFDPRIIFDPINQRWILVMDSNAQNANSSIEIAVSQTSDPQGSYFVFRFVVGQCDSNAAGCASGGSPGGQWADFPMLGFNKNWVAVSMNMFNFAGTSNNNDKVLVLDYPQLRAGVSSSTLFSNASIGVCNHPAETYDATQNTLFLAQHQNSNPPIYKLSTITGTPSAPVLTLGASNIRPGAGWAQASGEVLPQNCVTGSPVATFTCPATPREIDAGDSFLRNNVVYRNGSIWYAQTIGLPASGLTHTAAQWTKLDTAGTFLDGGIVEDPTATAINGGKWYAYPSVAVNKNNDMVMGFSQFASNQFASAGYAVRLNIDPAGTTRDPVVYKAGEDYYEKTFSGPRNRWGDYSATRIDPVNDRDMWTLQEYAQQRVGVTGLGTNDSRWSTFWAKVALPAGPGDLDISEFRLRGSNGASDEFIEIYNNTDAAITVNTADGSAGYAVASSSNTTLNDATPTVRFTIPNGTTIPARGHYLGTNSNGYSLSTYPAGNGTTATGDATYTSDIPDNVGIALFNTATAANFSTGTRLDAVGSTTESNTLYKEGAGYQALNVSGLSIGAVNYSLYRDLCGKQGSVTQAGGCPTAGLPRDSNNNAVDFVFTDPNATEANAGHRVGAPGPENLSSPIQRNNLMPGFLLDATTGSANSPNRVRDFTSDPTNHSTFGTLDIRRRIVNNTGSSVTRLRFRIVDVTIFPSTGTPGFADLRARTSTAVVVSGVNDAGTCPGGITPCTVTVQGTMLEQAASPNDQPNGGGFNSSLSADTVLATPLANGQSINVRFLLGIQATGTFKFFVNIETLP